MLPHVHTRVRRAFWAMHQSEKRGGSSYDFPRVVPMIKLSGGDVLPGYHSWFSARVILKAIGLPFRNAKSTFI